MKKIDIEQITCVDILIFNDKDELALQMRALDDDSFPGHWDFSVGGHVEPNEENQKAAEREIFEELGISGTPVFISKEHFEYEGWKSTSREVDAAIFRMSNNGPFEIDPKEVEKVVFFNLSDVQKMIDNGEKFHPEFILAWKRGSVLTASRL